jgi:hypothetical protein
VPKLIHQSCTHITPSCARYESLRFISRNSGDTGIDILLSITGYAIFLVIEVFFPSPSPSPSTTSSSLVEDRRLWEWIKMQPLDKDASVLESTWSDTTTITSTSTSTIHEVSHRPDSALFMPLQQKRHPSTRSRSRRYRMELQELTLVPTTI